MSRKKTIASVVVGIIFVGILLTFYTTFSLGEEYQFHSEVYLVEDGFIYGISPETKIEVFVDYFDLTNCKIKVLDLEKNEIVSGYVMDGSQTILMDTNGKVITSYENVIMGDFDQNGRVDSQDLQGMGRGLVASSFEEERMKSLDLDLDQEIHMNDLILLDKAMNGEYQELALEKSSMVLQSKELGRVGYSVKPSYGKNTNLKWSSSNSEVVTVRESGAIVGNQEGEAVVRAETLDGKLFQEIAVTVDNTIQLESYQGILYVGGKEQSIFIKSIDYEGITCSSSNESAVSCRIDGEYLVIKGISDGNAVITVTSLSYGSREYKAQAYSTYINLFPSYGCAPVNRTGSVIISSFLAGELSFEISDPNLIQKAYVSGNRFYVTAGKTAGRGEVVVRESNGNSSKTFVLDVYNLNIPVIGGFGKVGVEMEADIVAEGTETLSCVSPNPEIATCRVEGNRLYVMPLQLGEVQIEVINTITYQGTSNECGKTTFLAVIRE